MRERTAGDGRSRPTGDNKGLEPLAEPLRGTHERGGCVPPSQALIDAELTGARRHSPSQVRRRGELPVATQVANCPAQRGQTPRHWYARAHRRDQSIRTQPSLIRRSWQTHTAFRTVFPDRLTAARFGGIKQKSLWGGIPALGWENDK